MTPANAEAKENEEEIYNTLTYMRPARAIQDDQVHRKIQRSLVKVLRKEYGFENVSREHPAGYGAHAIDVVVRRNQTEFLYYRRAHQEEGKHAEDGEVGEANHQESGE